MFVTEAVLLKSTEIKDRERIYTLFTKQFWKIQAFRKEQPTAWYIDIGTHVECTIDRKGAINRLRNIRPIRAFQKEGRNYEATIRFLFVIKILSEMLPEWMIEGELFSETLTYLQLSEDQKFPFMQLSAFFCLRLGHYFGIQEISDPTSVLGKLIQLAHTNQLTELMRIQGITGEHIAQIHLHSLRIFQSSSSW